MLIQMIHKYSKRIVSERGGGIAIVAFGVVVLLVFIFTAMNILNSKLIEQGYNNLRDAVMSASSGSVIHLLFDADNTTITQKTQDTTITYDPYLQLALGYIINYEDTSSSSNSNIIGVEKNNFIKLDHKKVINSTLQLMDDIVLNGEGLLFDSSNFGKYQVVMFFIEPNYDLNYKKSFNLVYYTNQNPEHGTFSLIEGESMAAMYDTLERRISSIVNTEVGEFTNYTINLNADNDISNEELLRRMETRPYYLIVVKDFALPTIFGDATTQSEGIIKSFFGTDGSLTQPMCALQSGKIERRIINDAGEDSTDYDYDYGYGE